MRNNNQPGPSRSLSHIGSLFPAALRNGTGNVLRPRTILHPTDYSAESRQAFDVACRLAREWGSRLIVMHVAPPVYVSSIRMAPVPRLPAGFRDAWEDRLRRMQPSKPGIRIEHRLEEGDVADAIVRVAGEMSCDLIVMSSRERTWLERLFSGSVVAAVARKAPCPMFTVKPSPEGMHIKTASKLDPVSPSMAVGGLGTS